MKLIRFSVAPSMAMQCAAVNSCVNKSASFLLLSNKGIIMCVYMLPTSIHLSL